MKNFSKYDVLIVGGGIFGIATAIELSLRKYKVGLINPDTIPHHLASSTDISKAVRMEYGADKEYMRMAEISIQRWREWNIRLGEELYHEVGFLMLCREKMEASGQKFEMESCRNLAEMGYPSIRLDADALGEQFPAINTDIYQEASFNPVGGYADSGRAVEKLAAYAKTIGVTIHSHQTAKEFIIENRRCIAVDTREGSRFHFDHVVVAAGPHTPYLLPILQPFIKITGHSIFWLKPEYPPIFTPPQLAVFTADISNTGWYGFPLHPQQGVVKIGRHSTGQPIHPDHDDRIVSIEEIKELRIFLKDTFPELKNAPLIHTRKCLYTDTLDGHFWIDRHPELEGMTICTGGSGHGFKMGPIVGEMAADVVEGKEHEFAQRYRWRHLSHDTVQEEEARNVKTMG